MSSYKGGSQQKKGCHPGTNIPLDRKNNEQNARHFAGTDGITVTDISTPRDERARYFNVAAITSRGSTISTQRWVKTYAEAEEALFRWISPDHERWSEGLVAFASIYDTLTKDTTYYRRVRDRLDIIEGPRFSPGAKQ